MKLKLLIPIIILLLILIVGGVIGFLVFVNKEDNTFVLVKETGNLFYKSSEDSEYTEIFDVEITLNSGTYIKTGEDSFARVFLPDNSLISIDELTEIQITVEAKEINIDQFLGKTWNRVQTVSKGGEYNIKTPNAIAAVRGTVFGTDVVNDNLSKIFVEESKVEISRYEEQDGEDRILETIDLEKGELAVIIRDEQSFRIEKSSLTDEYKELFWYLRNRIIDAEYFRLLNDGKSGEDLREELQNNLEQRDDYKDFLFGLEPEDEVKEEAIEDKLQDVFDITKITGDTCVRFTQSDFQLALDKVRAYSEYITNPDPIADLLINLKNSCEDGSFSLSEEESLRATVDSINSK